jgi:hypothetical protein
VICDACCESCCDVTSPSGLEDIVELQNHGCIAAVCVSFKITRLVEDMARDGLENQYFSKQML